MRPEMIRILVRKLSDYYRCTLSEGDYEFWITAFDDATEDEFKAAAKAFIKTGAEFFPKAGQVYQYVTKARDDARLDGLPTVSAGIAEIRETLGCGCEGIPTYSHPLLDRVVKMLGYWNLGHMNSIDVPRAIGQTYGELRKNFIAGHEPIVERALLDWRRVREIGEGHAS